MPAVTVRGRGGVRVLDVPAGTVLRDALLAAGLSPYARLTRRANCGGRGLCATCGVWLRPGTAPPPVHWHDRLAAAWGYPRLSCQVVVENDLDVTVPDKVVWGRRDSRPLTAPPETP